MGRYRKAYFETYTSVDIGDEGRLPPPLTGVGAKLKTEWIGQVLQGKGHIRGHMRIRMPVFAAEQVRGYPIEVPDTAGDNHRNQQAEEYFRRTGAKVHSGLDRAYYSPSGDYIGMPALGQFDTTDAYYSTLFHELTHWTGTHNRCHREMGRRFGDKQYAIEELVAELGAIFHCLHLGVIAHPKEESAKYLNSWLRVLNF